jgi:lysophospholipase L1-like esterase
VEVERHVGPLGTFYDALADLEAGRRKDHVRIAWLGDSHAQADFWPDGIRAGLGRRFGHGGPGFLHFGMKSYRHAGTEIDIHGKWRMRPKQPSTIEPWGDGAFGLGGILHAGFAEFRTAEIALTNERLTGKKLVVDLCYKFGLPYDSFELTVGDEVVGVFEPKGKEAVGTIQHEVVNATGLTKVKVKIKNGRPDFCGLTIETDPAEHPGVVLDNLGINGARYATALAWNEKAWAAEVQRRTPELFIFEYGGNEAGDLHITPALYKKQALELIARARRIQPDASCWVIGPSDRADAESRIPPIVQVLSEAAQEARCAFWNTYEVMGGKGSLRRWRDLKKAAEDGIHLKPKGYAEVSALMLADLMKGYRPPVKRP